ncbi:hypothetical protein EST38_g10796 [Candolleomyces aberdarensis]|uniref:Extracellular membrane protein CFEM domain-containing protein n=1 Tax=Candolleomyces aberdarensis TaxID=2316362 RepID=A0A4Q2D6H2_9AGAR|nr:hypothetical protein EST38_g10796 [Candolleomyces aberdarensis]
MRSLVTVGALVAVVQAAASTSHPLIARQVDLLNVPPACNATCEPALSHSLRCAEEAEDVAVCDCVPEFVTATNACAECVGNQLNPKPADFDSQLDEAYEGFLEICKAAGVESLPPRCGHDYNYESLRYDAGIQYEQQQ